LFFSSAAAETLDMVKALLVLLLRLPDSRIMLIIIHVAGKYKSRNANLHLLHLSLGTRCRQIRRPNKFTASCHGLLATSFTNFTTTATLVNMK